MERRGKLKVLLGVEDDGRLSIFKNLASNSEFEIKKVFHKKEELKLSLLEDEFDLIVVQDNLNQESTIEYFYETVSSVLSDTPIIFIINKEDSVEILTRFSRLVVDFIHHRNVTPDLILFTFRTAIARKRLIQVSNENENRYKQLFQHSFDINLICDGTLSITEKNLLADRSLHKSINHVHGLFKDNEDFNNFHELVLKKGILENFETTLILEDDESECIIDVFPLKNLDEIDSGYHIIIKNVGVEKKIRRNFERTNKLEITGKLMRTLAHEIRNPLTNLVLSVEQFTTDKKLNDDDKFYFEIINRSISRIQNLLTEMMSAYKTSSVKLQPTNIEDVIQEAIALAIDRAALRNIVVNQIYCDDNLMINADREMLKIAILNLIINALEAVKDETGRIDVVVREKNDLAIVLIRDNGIGMNNEQLTHLFDPYYSGKSKGLGLGLTATQNIFNAHSADIDVVSVPDFGTTFEITFEKL